MRVVHVVPALFGEGGIVGGAERYAFELARHMADVVPTTLVTFGDADADEHGRARCGCGSLGGPWYVRGQRTNPVSRRLLGALRAPTSCTATSSTCWPAALAAVWCRADSARRVFVSDLGGGGWDVSAYVSTDRWFHGHLHLSEYSRRCSAMRAHPRAHVIGGGVDTRKFSPDASVVARRRARCSSAGCCRTRAWTI